MINESVQEQIEAIADKCARIRPLVVVSCITYNHEAYLRDALEGFVMQKADFPFVAVVHDDASTDGTAAIVREYAALCEGDDYWTDPLKLKKQVDALEAHPECSIALHRVQAMDREKNVLDRTLAPFYVL